MYCSWTCAKFSSDRGWKVTDLTSTWMFCRSLPPVAENRQRLYLWMRSLRTLFKMVWQYAGTAAHRLLLFFGSGRRTWAVTICKTNWILYLNCDKINCLIARTCQCKNDAFFKFVHMIIYLSVCMYFLEYLFVYKLFVYYLVVKFFICCIN